LKNFSRIPVTITESVNYGFVFNFFVRNLRHFICGENVKFILGDIGWWSAFIKDGHFCFKIVHDGKYSHLEIEESLQVVFGQNNLEIIQYKTNVAIQSWTNVASWKNGVGREIYYHVYSK